MNQGERDLLDAFELHSVEQIRSLLDAGVDPLAPIEGKTPVDWLLEMYSRSDAFPACLRLLLDRGGALADPALEPVLLNDGPAVTAAVGLDRSLLSRRFSLVSTFTPLVGATALHVAAEYGHLEAARALIEAGADVDARADFDEHGLNGHTPLFHTVNSSRNRSAPLMRLLIEAGADVSVKLEGITWGKGFEWETTLFDVTPLSYCQFGLLPQVHRRDVDTYANIKELLNAAGRSLPPLENIPNRYLHPKTGS